MLVIRMSVTSAYPRGSIYTTIRELGPKIPYCRRNYGPNSLMVIYVDPLGIF